MCVCVCVCVSAEIRKDVSSQYHNTLYTGDVAERVKLLRTVGQGESRDREPVHTTSLFCCDSGTFHYSLPTDNVPFGRTLHTSTYMCVSVVELGVWVLTT